MKIAILPGGGIGPEVQAPENGANSESSWA